MRCFAVAAITLLAQASLASADELDIFAVDSDNELVNQFDTMQDGAPRSLSDNSTATTTTDGTISTTAASGTISTTAASVTTATTKEVSTTAAPSSTSGTTTPKPLAVIKGSLGMKVSNLAEFVKDPAVKEAIGDSIAKLVGISKDFVSVTLRVVTRRLAMQSRRLAEGSVEAEYTITIPAAAPASGGGAATVSVDVAAMQKTLKETSAADFSKRVGTEMTAKGVTSFTVEVTSVSAPTLEIVEDENMTTVRPPAPSDATVRLSPGIFAASLFALAGLGLA